MRRVTLPLFMFWPVKPLLSSGSSLDLVVSSVELQYLSARLKQIPGLIFAILHNNQQEIA